MTAESGIREELINLYARRTADSVKLNAAHKTLEKATSAFQSAQRPVFWANDRIEALRVAWRALTTDDFPADPGGKPSV